MAKHSKFRIVQAVIMNSLLVIIIALMIASLFSILLINDDAPTGSLSSREPQRVSVATCPAYQGGTATPGFADGSWEGDPFTA